MICIFVIQFSHELKIEISVSFVLLFFDRIIIKIWRDGRVVECGGLENR